MEPDRTPATPADLPHARPLRQSLDMVRRAVRSHGLWHPGDRVLVACSGGPDSMGLLALLVALQPSLGHTLAVAHVDHGLRPESGAVAAQVRLLAESLALPVAVVRVVLTPGAQVEARARDERYRALARVRGDLGCACAATAHHTDDLAETLLLRMARGAGPDALAGIRRMREDGVVRPALDLDRSQLAAWARWAGWLATADLDPMNRDARHARTRVRSDALPALERALPGAVRGLARTADALAQHDGALDGWIRLALGTRIVEDPAHRSMVVDLAGVALDRPCALALVRHLASRLGTAAPSLRALDNVWRWHQRGRRTPCYVHGLLVTTAGTGWRIVARDVADPAPAD